MLLLTVCLALPCKAVNAAAHSVLEYPQLGKDMLALTVRLAFLALCQCMLPITCCHLLHACHWSTSTRRLQVADRSKGYDAAAHPIHHEASYAVRALIDGDLMPHLVQLVSSSHASRPTANDCHFLASPLLRGAGDHPPHLKALQK